MHFPRLGTKARPGITAATLFADCPAVRATTRLIFETFRGKKVLFGNSKNEIASTVTAF